jgi:hypothetical protein
MYSTTVVKAGSAQLGLFSFVIAVGLAAGAGVFLAAQMLARGSDDGRVRGEVGQPVDTSFGQIAVTDVRRIDDAHGDGQAHSGHFSGPGSIPQDRREVQVEVALANRTEGLVPYSPRGFAVRLGPNGLLVSPSEATFFKGTLQPGGVIDGQLTFLVPSDVPRLWLQFRDPGLADPILIDLGATATATEAGGAGHRHDHL